MQFVLHVSRQPGGEAPITDDAPVEVLLADIGTRHIETLFQFSYVFNLGRRAASQLFPVKFPLFGTTSIDEIRGFRGVKFRGPRKSHRYELTVESGDLKDLYIDVAFKRRLIFHADIINQVLREATGVVREVIPESEWGD